MISEGVWIFFSGFELSPHFTPFQAGTVLCFALQRSDEGKSLGWGSCTFAALQRSVWPQWLANHRRRWQSRVEFMKIRWSVDTRWFHMKDWLFLELKARSQQGMESYGPKKKTPKHADTLFRSEDSTKRGFQFWLTRLSWFPSQKPTDSFLFVWQRLTNILLEYVVWPWVSSRSFASIS